MKKLTLLIVLLFPCIFLHATKGLYVDGFASIIGNTNKEDSLLNYAQQNGFTYLALYELHLVHASHNLTTVPTSAPLATFISKAKTMYGVTEIGACGENFWWFDNIISVYNLIHANPAEQIDIYNYEFEFWNLGSVGPGQYYCTTYLQPGGYSCDTSGAFAFYIKELKSIDSLATVDGLTSEIYVGWFNQHQATQMKSKVDRILLHSYVANVNSVYSYAQTRLSYLGNTPGVVNVMPIYSSEPAFLGPWLVTNPEVNVDPIYVADFASETGLWKANINLLGYQWFAYSMMPYGLAMNIDEENTDLSIYPNPFTHSIEIKNTDQLEVQLKIYNISGDLLMQTRSTDKKIYLHLDELSPGMYGIYMEVNNQVIFRRIMKQ
jgi:hypothetical protein